MVVSAQQVDGRIRAALTLVQVVGDVAREVRGLAVRLDEDAVLVVAVGGRAQPHRAALIEDHAALAQALNRLGHRTGVVQGVLVEEDVEVSAEGVQAFLNLSKHQLDAAGAEDLDGLVLGQRDRVGFTGGVRIGADLVGDVSDVLAAVAILRDLAARGARVERVGKAVDLRAVVVEVVLASHGGTGGSHEARQGVTDGGPASTAQVHGTGRIRGHILEVDGATRERRVTTILSPGLDDSAGKFAGCPRAQADVDEAGTRDLDRIDAVGGGESVREDLCKLARCHASLLAELHGDVGRPVAVLAHAGTLDRHRIGHQGGVDGDSPGGGSVQQRRANKGGKFFRSHPFSLRGFASSPLTYTRRACENLATRGPPGRLSSRDRARVASKISGSRTFPICSEVSRERHGHRASP